MLQWKFRGRQPPAVCLGTSWPGRPTCQSNSLSTPDAIGRCSLHRTDHRSVYASGRCDPCADHRSRLCRLRDRMGCNLCLVSLHGPLRNTAGTVEAVSGRMVGRRLWAVRSYRDVADESRSGDPRAFHRVRMAGAGYLDRSRCDLAPAEHVCTSELTFSPGPPRPFSANSASDSEA